MEFIQAIHKKKKKMTFKQFKTNIRKFIGYVGVDEFAEDPIDSNSLKRWEQLYADPKFLKQYVSKDRLNYYTELFETLNRNKVFEYTKSVMDVGCGTGHFLLTISKSFPQIHLSGTDFSEEGLQVARSVVPSAEFMKDDVMIQNTEWIEKFDMVCCSEVLEHLLNPEDALKNLISYVKPTGYLILGVPNGRLDTYAGHIQFWSPESWRAFLIRNLPEIASVQIQTLQIENERNNLAIIKK